MSDLTSDLDTSEPVTLTPAPPRIIKSATVIKLLSRNRGATLAEMMSTTNWQPHTTRAFLTGLRKKGKVLIRESRRDGETSYRIDA